MATLHMVNKSPFEDTSLESCLRHVLKGDAVLLIEDGVYGAIKGSAVSDTLGQHNGTVSLYALGPDLAARGLAEKPLVGGIEVVDYVGFVDLVTKLDRSQSWL